MAENKSNVTGDAGPRDGTGSFPEALKFLSDWSKWLVTVETFAISAIAAMMKLQDLGKLQKTLCGIMTLACAAVAALCFAVSIHSASVVLLSIPEIAEKHPGKTVFECDAVSTGPGKARSIGSYTSVQQCCFALGIFLFASSIVLMAWTGSSLDNRISHRIGMQASDGTKPTR